MPKTPYELLEISPDADDHDIKLAYLRLIKQFPPDHDQEHFQVLHQAYQAIKDHKARLAYSLFSIPPIDFGQLLDQALERPPSLAISPGQFAELLALSIDEQTILNAIPDVQKP